MDMVKLRSGLGDIERKIVDNIGESYNKFFISGNENLSSHIQSSIDHSNDIKKIIKSEVDKIRSMCLADNTEAIPIKSTVDGLERKIVDHIEESYNKFIASVNENLSCLIQSSIGHSNDIINILKNEVDKIRNMCRVDDAEAISTDVNADRFQIKSALDDLERKIVDNIGESYNQFIVSVNENLSCLIQSSIGHSKDIISILRNEIGKIQNMYLVDDKEAIRNSGRRNLKIALDRLEKEIIDHIADSYNQFMFSVDENLSSPIESSMGHSKKIIDIFENEVTKIRDICRVGDKEAKSTDVNAGAQKFLMLRPISELMEYPAQSEHHRKVIEHSNQISKKRKASGEINKNNQALITEESPRNDDLAIQLETSKAVTNPAISS